MYSIILRGKFFRALARRLRHRWYTSTGDRDKVYAFESGNIAFQKLENAIEKSAFSYCARIEDEALSIEMGFLAWSELRDAFPCSHSEGYK